MCRDLSRTDDPYRGSSLESITDTIPVIDTQPSHLRVHGPCLSFSVRDQVLYETIQFGRIGVISYGEYPRVTTAKVQYTGHFHLCTKGPVSLDDNLLGRIPKRPVGSNVIKCTGIFTN
ncbi:hypothetical protein M408DRAFT_249126 [Serendipita vermifera MAFF 305830]|uniref:Uncharacterized protein n=1 Tax=Serendipita vermifera MAFF 305830 TaxID=933852 RepID=A0A0C2WBW5_SERVB|nr:hypothetical protein M408DRAFT_249126 [Serendipita vermifera MAFF 305830]